MDDNTKEVILATIALINTFIAGYLAFKVTLKKK